MQGPLMRCFVFVGTLLWAIWAQAIENRIYGRVTFQGRGVPQGQVVRVEASQTFFLFGGRSQYAAIADRSGRFALDNVPDGFYWVVAYVDENRDGRRNPGEITGYPRLAPIYVGPKHRKERVKINLDPVHAILATRFIPGEKSPPKEPRLELAFVAVSVRDPRTGKVLTDAHVELDEDGITQMLTFDPSFPGGAYVAYGEGRLAGERFVFHVSHPSLGKTPRRLVLHSRSLGVVPRFTDSGGTLSPSSGTDLVVTWHQPAWVNFATIELYEHTPTGVRRLWPETPAEAVSSDRQAVIPGTLLQPGRRLHLALILGRADVRAEHGEIWATAVSKRSIVVAEKSQPTGRKENLVPQTQESHGRSVQHP